MPQGQTSALVPTGRVHSILYGKTHIDVSLHRVEPDQTAGRQISKRVRYQMMVAAVVVPQVAAACG